MCLLAWGWGYKQPQYLLHKGYGMRLKTELAKGERSTIWQGDVNPMLALHYNLCWHCQSPCQRKHRSYKNYILWLRYYQLQGGNGKREERMEIRKLHSSHGNRAAQRWEWYGSRELQATLLCQTLLLCFILFCFLYINLSPRSNSRENF